MQNYPSYAVTSKPVSAYQTKANIHPTRRKGICNCGRSGRGDLCVQNTIAQFFISPFLGSTATSLPTHENVKSKVENEARESVIEAYTSDLYHVHNECNV